MKRNGFFTVEGNEGAGKTSLIGRLSEHLRELGLDVVVTREPGGIPIAEQIRKVILHPGNTAMDGRTEALLYAAARRQHYVEKIVPALQSGKTILCDRFIDSSLAYQGHARGIGIDEVWDINMFAIEHALPDLTFYLDVDPETGLRRIHANDSREINRLDMESLAFHQKVREGYLEVCRRFPERIIRIDANQSAERVFAEAKRAIQRFFSR